MKVRDVMAKTPVTIEPEAPVGTALDVMRTQHVRHLPVVDEAGALMGIVTDRDLRHAAFAPAVQEYLSIRARRLARQLGEALEKVADLPLHVSHSDPVAHVADQDVPRGAQETADRQVGP